MALSRISKSAGRNPRSVDRRPSPGHPREQPQSASTTLRSADPQRSTATQAMKEFAANLARSNPVTSPRKAGRVVGYVYLAKHGRDYKDWQIERRQPPSSRDCTAPTEGTRTRSRDRDRRSGLQPAGRLVFPGRGSSTTTTTNPRRDFRITLRLVLGRTATKTRKHESRRYETEEVSPDTSRILGELDRIRYSGWSLCQVGPVRRVAHAETKDSSRNPNEPRRCCCGFPRHAACLSRWRGQDQVVELLKSAATRL